MAATVGAILSLTHDESNIPMLALSVIPHGDTKLMKKYARGIKPGEDPFAGVEIFETPDGIDSASRPQFVE